MILQIGLDCFPLISLVSFHGIFASLKTGLLILIVHGKESFLWFQGFSCVLTSFGFMVILLHLHVTVQQAHILESK